MTEWTDLLSRLSTMSEDDLREAIAVEARRNEPRASYLTRLHMRLCKLRTTRERRELLRRGHRVGPDAGQV